MTGRRAAAALLLMLAAAWPLEAATRYDPRLRFQTLATARFDIYFHQGEERAARRMARIAEDVADRLAGELGRPRGRVHVILVNQTDLSNGWATPIPYNLIEINTVPPPGASVIGNTDDWLRMVFTHEYTHIVHLDTGRGWSSGLRRVFGRLAPLYPNLFLPIWQIEGIATYNESAITGGGRVPAGDFRMMLDTAARVTRFDPLDRASGGLVDWPGGNGAYLYGAYFHQYLADRYGAASLVRLSHATAGRVPYVSSPAFRQVFGRSLGQLWQDFEAATVASLRDDTNLATRVTRHGFTVTSPRFGGDGRLLYAQVDPHGFPAILELTAAAMRTGGAPRTVTTKYLGGQVSTAGETIVFDQLELVRNAALQSDLYARSLQGGPVHRLTRGARAGNPDLSPDGRTIVCVLQSADRRALATLPFRATTDNTIPATLISEADTEFTSPRWSPDGRTIAVTRRRLGGPSEIVIVEAATGVVRTIVSSSRGRNVTPIWRPDGRTILFASDRDGAGFRIHDVDIETGATRRLDGTGPDAQSPALSPDGATLVFVGYTVDGHDLFSMSMASSAWTAVATEVAGSFAPPADPPAATTTPYRPWQTLAPRYWSPVADSDSGEVRVGATTSGADALGRHGYAATVEWAGARLQPDWQIAYAYDRWWPTLFAGVSDDTDPWRSGTSRSREANVGVLLPARSVRWAQTTLVGFHASNLSLDCACLRGDVPAIERRALRLGWSASSAKAYGYSISSEDGGVATAATELTRRALGSSGDGGSATIDARGYRRLFLRHGVVAARVAAGTSWGDATVRRQFRASGAGPPTSAFAFGEDAVALLRGFDEQALVGAHAAVVNLDYRFPLLSVQRGLGTLPIFLRTVHGAVFTDSGQAWTSRFARSRTRTSVGAELSLDTIVGHSLPLTLTGGVAWRADPLTERRGAAVFGRVGRAF